MSKYTPDGRVRKPEDDIRVILPITINLEHKQVTPQEIKAEQEKAKHGMKKFTHMLKK